MFFFPGEVLDTLDRVGFNTEEDLSHVYVTAHDAIQAILEESQVNYSNFTFSFCINLYLNLYCTHINTSGKKSWLTKIVTDFVSSQPSKNITAATSM